MSSSHPNTDSPTEMQSAISDLAKQISHLAVAQTDSAVQHGSVANKLSTEEVRALAWREGEESIDEALARFEVMARSLKWDEKSKIVQFSRLLERELQVEFLAQGFANFIIARRWLQKMYREPYAEDEARTKFLASTQDGMSCLEFAKLIRKRHHLVDYINNPLKIGLGVSDVFDEKQRVGVFIRGLNPYIKGMYNAQIQQLKEWSEVIRLAKSIDHSRGRRTKTEPKRTIPKARRTLNNMKTVICQGCGKPRHLKKNCWHEQRKSRTRERGQIKAVQKENEHSSDEKELEEIVASGMLQAVRSNCKVVKVQARLKNHDVIVLIDSGADTNYLSLKWLKESLPEHKVWRYKKPKSTVLATNGAKAEIVGRTTLELELGKTKKKVNFEIMKELREDVLIGTSGIESLKINILGDEKAISIDGNRIQWEGVSKQKSLSLQSTQYESECYKALEQNDPPEVTKGLIGLEKIQKKQEKFQLGDALDHQQKKEIESLLESYEDVFEERLEPANVPQFEIELEAKVKPPHNRRLSGKEQARAEEVLKDFVEAGVVKESKAEIAHNLVMVPKPDGTIRGCVDLRPTNKATKLDKYPLPRIDTILTRFRGIKFLATIDLKSGYWQVPLRREDQEKTAFKTNNGLFEFTRMPFGLTNAPAHFQRIMDKIFGEAFKAADCAQWYLDDISVGGRKFKEFRDNLEKVLTQLRRYNLQAKKSKCFFAYTRMKLLGFDFQVEGWRPHLERIKSLKELPSPRNKRELRGILGLFNYFRHFIPHMALMTKPLSRMTGKEDFVWTNNCEERFEMLKNTLAEETMLVHPNTEEDFQMLADASKIAIAAVLMQDGKPIWFASRTLNAAESNYPPRQQEALAIIFGLKKFHYLIHGKTTEVFTDHNSLKWLMQGDHKDRLARWAVTIQHYDIKVTPISGAKNVVADCLSRLIKIKDSPVLQMIKRSNPATPQVVVKKMKNDPALRITTDGINPNVKAVDRPIGAKEKLKEEILEDLEETGALEALPMRTILGISVHEFEERQKLDPEVLALKKSRDDIKILDGLFVRGKNQQLVIPMEFRFECIRRAHSRIQAAHPGMERTKQILLAAVWWPGLSRDVEQYVSRCIICQKYKGNPDKTSVRRRAQRDPFECIAIDVFGPLPKYEDPWGDTYTHILGIQDVATKYCAIVPIREKTMICCLEAIERNWLAYFPVPKVLIADHAFKNNAFINGMKHHECSVHITGVEHSRSNPEERLNRFIGDALRVTVQRDFKEILETCSWIQATCIIQKAYNRCRHKTTGIAPLAWVCGVNEKIDGRNTTMDRTKIKIKKENDRKEYLFQQKTLKPGDFVFWYRKNPSTLQPKAAGPYRVLSHQEKGSVEIMGSKGPTKVHTSALKKIENQIKNS